MTKIVQGNQPFSQSYVLTVTSPANLPATAASPVTVPLNLSVLSKPSGVLDATTLGFISLAPASLTFTGPNQVQTITVTVAVPLGNFAGDYAYKILPSGWPVTTDGISDAGATVNATASPASATDNSPPAITLLTPAAGTVYTYQPATGVPVSVPISFAASVNPTGLPIDTMLAFMDGNSLAVSATGLLTFSASGTAAGVLITPGTHTVSVLATNRNGTSRATADVSVVVVAPPPVITVASPLANANFTSTLGGAAASVPVSVSAASLFGNVTALAATLDGNTVTLSLSGVGGATTAVGSASLLVSSPGSHSLVFTAANAYGAATPVTVPFTVTSVTPAPTVTILTPANGATVYRINGTPPTVVNYNFQGGTSYGTVTAVRVTLDGAVVSPSITGLNSASITGSGSTSFTAAGPHTINVTLTSSGGATASASTTFTIALASPVSTTELVWLPPISLNKTIDGGSVMPIAFKVKSSGAYVKDTDILIATYEVFANGTHSTPKIYPYGSGSNANPPDYAIDGDKTYRLNFTTADGSHVYRVEVYDQTPTGQQLLGTQDINTRRVCGWHDYDDNDDHDRDCDGRHNRFQSCNHNRDRGHDRDCDRDHDRYRSCNHNEHDRDDDYSWRR